MTIKNLFFAAFVLHLQLQVNGQFYSTSSASTGAEIIVPVGTEKSGDMITGSFYSSKERSIVELSSTGIQVNGKSPFTDMEKAVVPILHVVSSQQAYSITFSYDQFINNRDNRGETIRIESINIFPVNITKWGQAVDDQFSIGAKLLMAPYQAPGQYIAVNPYTITVHFN
ncbi:MAG: DUF4402 domain-containing protein [Chitinophagaceae bacterium]|nr:DUF4402 domain-containing protein [Chitinophagaceae bacterium]